MVGPACVLTHGTAGISFIALQFSNSDLIRTFGEAGLIATVIALLAVLSLVPLLGVLLVRKEAVFAAKIQQGSDFGVDRAAPLLQLGGGAHGEPSGALQPGRPAGGRRDSAFIYANLEPRYRLADQVPDKRQAVEASSRLDAKLTGANPIDVLIEFPKGAGLYDAADAGRPSPRSIRSSRSRPASAMSGRSTRCGAGSPRRPARPISRRSSNTSISCRST